MYVEVIEILFLKVEILFIV